MRTGESGDDWEDRVDFWATAVLVPLFAYWGPTQFGVSDALARASTGALLEIAGLLRAAVSLERKVAEAHGEPRLAVRVGRRLRRPFLRAWRWLKEWFRTEPEPQTVGVGTAKAEATAGSVGVSKSPREEPTLEDRVEWLEHQVSRLRRRIGEVHTDAQQRADRLEKRLRRVRSDLREADQKQKELLKRVTVGGFEWEVLGLVWFLLGVVVATWGPYLPLP